MKSPNKVHKGMSKRFFRTGNDAIKHRQSNRAHLNRKRTARYMSNIRKNATLGSNLKEIAKKIKKLI